MRILLIIYEERKEGGHKGKTKLQGDRYPL